MWELTKSFRFEAAHSLSGTTFGAGGEEIHGHSYRAEVKLRGKPDAVTGMIVDTGVFERNLAEIRRALDHKHLNRIDGLGPPTLENLARFIWDHVQGVGEIACVTVYRDSCNEACSYFGPTKRPVA
jgi:6-pyruvoyltetrahydropterin/6-carboxytetrahydropterin synthase